MANMAPACPYTIIFSALTEEDEEKQGSRECACENRGDAEVLGIGGRWVVAVGRDLLVLTHQCSNWVRVPLPGIRVAPGTG
jgi:hypothetical protein